MPKYFNQTKYKSFQRQLNLYGFVRIHQGYYKGSYGNKNFRREDLSSSVLPRPKVTRSLARNKPANSFSSISTIDLQAILNSEAEPISLEWDKTGSSNATFLEPAFHDQACCLSAEVLLFVKDLFKKDATASVDAGGVLNDLSDDPLFQSMMMNDPILLSLERNKSDLVIAGHAPEEEKQVSEVYTRRTEHSFPWKLHDMLEEAESRNFSHIVSWEPDGISFQVHKVDEFFKAIMPLYFDQTKYDSFRRQLDLYSFSRVAPQVENNSGIYCHSSLVKGDRSLCKEIKRRP